MNSLLTRALRSDDRECGTPDDSRNGIHRRNGEFETLTRRELETLQLIAEGYARKEIADRMGISRGTVDQFIKRVYDKLRVHSKTEAAILYLKRQTNGHSVLRIDTGPGSQVFQTQVKATDI